MAIFFFNDTATTEIYTLSLHDALPIFCVTCTSIENGCPTLRPDTVSNWAVTGTMPLARAVTSALAVKLPCAGMRSIDRKSTRLNSSHANISYAVFCLKHKENGFPQQGI